MNRKTARGPARPPFELIEHPADVGIRVYGRALAALFAHAALGLCSLITDTDTVLERETRSVEVAAPDRESLLVAWLSEVLWLIETEDLLFARFTIELALRHGTGGNLLTASRRTRSGTPIEASSRR